MDEPGPAASEALEPSVVQLPLQFGEAVEGVGDGGRQFALRVATAVRAS
jgi:hypothetical protein